MHIASHHCFLIMAMALCAGGGLAQAQSNSAPVAATPARDGAKAISPGSLNTLSQPGKSSADQLIEKITVDDGGARISELRFGGETRSITVQPKGGLPAYDVRPISGADIQPTNGTRTWKILGF